MQSYKYVIIGGGLAGGRASDGIRSVDTEGTIALVTEERHMPYQRPPLSKGYLMGKEGLEEVFLREDIHYAENSIEVLTGTRAVKVDPQAHSVALDDGQRAERRHQTAGVFDVDDAALVVLHRHVEQIPAAAEAELA